MSGKLIVFFMIFALAQAGWLGSFDFTKLAEKFSQSNNSETTSAENGTDTDGSEDEPTSGYKGLTDKLFGNSNGDESASDATTSEDTVADTDGSEEPTTGDNGSTDYRSGTHKTRRAAGLAA